MDNTKLYQDIAKRTQGDIYIGVVGPVRTGKSTFIRKFMENLVLPNIENEFYLWKRARLRVDAAFSCGPFAPCFVLFKWQCVAVRFSIL